MPESVKNLSNPMPDLPLRWVPLPPIRDVFQGACPDGVEPPRNALMFTHDEVAGLQSGARGSYQHGRFVLVLNAGGPGRVAVDGRWLRFRPGEALLVFPYQVHTYGGLPEDGRLRWLFLTFEQADATRWAPLRDRVVPAPGEAWEQAAAAREAWRVQGREGHTLPYLAGLLLETLREAALARPSARPPGAAPGGRARSLLARVHALVHRPEAGAPRLKDLALTLGLSEPHLRASFRRELGRSLGAYLRDVRLARAGSLLVGTDLAVAEVARRCGYDSPYSFSRAFRKEMGRSPRAYRRTLRAGDGPPATAAAKNANDSRPRPSAR